MRILFTSVGRRVELIQAFRDAARHLQIELQIMGADISETAPAIFFCDRYIRTCRISDPKYIQKLIDICRVEKVDVLIPTIDTDLLLLSQNKEQFKAIGTRVCVSGEESIRLCRDKRLTEEFLLECGLFTPTTVDDVNQYSAGFPCFIKPQDGSSSVNAFKIESADILREQAAQIENYIIQPFIEGEEYTVDIFCDFEGVPLLITPRIRLAVRGGEVLKTEIRQDAKIIDECRKIVKKLVPIGAITVQLIRQKDTGKDYYIEINPRYGGGAPLSVKAGADSAELLIRLLRGENALCGVAAHDGVIYSRFDQSVCVNPQADSIKAVVFDLDDTLYSEKDYVRSGYGAVAALLPCVESAAEKLWDAFDAGLSAIDAVLQNSGIYSDSLKERCVAAYREHMPKIQLYAGVHELLSELRAHGIHVGILTDGRPSGQRKKLQALGLEALVDSVLITDELGGEAFRKPDDIAFRIMQRRLQVSFSQMVYVGDNPQKDFIAPIQLGMQTIWFANQDGIYASQVDNSANRRMDSIAALRKYLCR